jgi:hypothetical protein
VLVCEAIRIGFEVSDRRISNAPLH